MLLFVKARLHWRFPAQFRGVLTSGDSAAIWVASSLHAANSRLKSQEKSPV